MTYGHFKDLLRGTASNKVLRNKAFNIAKNPKYDGNQRTLSSMIYNSFDKKSASLADKSATGSGVTTLSNKFSFNNKIKQNLQLAEELHKPIIEKLEKRTVYSAFKDNIWGANLADMQSVSKFNKGFRLLCSFKR